ncbi:hypothetical protein ZWY2020_057588 [Hordeum vulgare]|nr:hypothetical protein ZWY2020_057588 [Hordeum vulgare]
MNPYDNGNFESRFVVAPKVNFSKYNGVRLECFYNDDIQALCQKFLFEIITCNDNEIQLPLVTYFMKSHGFPIFK